jgi:hypothetical protein
MRSRLVAVIAASGLALASTLVEARGPGGEHQVEAGLPHERSGRGTICRSPAGATAALGYLPLNL